MKNNSENDPFEDTKDTKLGWVGEDSDSKPVVVPPSSSSSPKKKSFPPQPIRRKRRRGCGCFSVFVALIILLTIYFILPFNTRTLLLGTDSRDSENSLGRTDTMILTSVNPLDPKVVLLSIPRDLWINIPGYGENRINAAYFFAEAESPGTGVGVVNQTLEANFGVSMQYYALLKFNGIVDLVDAMGGVDIDLPRAMSGYDEGIQHLDGTQALAFVRDRSGSDDFFRMERGQLFVNGLISTMTTPASILRIPFVLFALPNAVETDLPFWLMPRIGLAMLRAGPDGIDGRAIDRDMAVPFTTAQGASVLLPNWDLIWPVVNEMFE